MERRPERFAKGSPEIVEAAVERDRLHAEVHRLRERLAERRGRVEKLKGEVHRLREILSKRTWMPGYARYPRYDEMRRDFFAKCQSRGGLEPDYRIIDIGCGIGGVARELLAYLSLDGGYDGLDVDSRAVELCQRDLEPLHPGFRFQLIDVKNSKYRPHGITPAGEYLFPFDDETFDLAILRSVFTHMMPGDVEHYLSEVARLLRPGRRSMITFVLVAGDADVESDDEREYMQVQVPHRRDGYRIADADNPEALVAYPIDWVRGLYAKVGLRIVEPIEFSPRRMPTWRQELRMQDLVVAERD
jgi:SAM-dependent methyltransferase